MSAKPWRTDHARSMSVHPRILRRDVETETVHLTLLDEAGRPRTRGDCDEIGRPCPWVGCRYHLLLDVDEQTGTIKFNFGHDDPSLLDVSCALDAADAGGATLDEVGSLINCTRERARQLEVRSMISLRRAGVGK